MILAQEEIDNVTNQKEQKHTQNIKGKLRKRQQKRKKDKWFIYTKFKSDTQLGNRYIKIIKAGKQLK